jgi:glycosyltransferase involved in cell wall biosynthesis
LAPQKAPDVAALAAARMTRPRPFVFAGAGNLERRVRGILRRNRCEERCRLVGEIAELPSLLRAFDILALPSRYEGLPYILLEALAAGLRVVAANAPGTRLAHPFGKEISTVPANAPDALAAELDRAVEQTEAEKRGQAQAHQLPPVPDRYRFETQVRSLLKLYTHRETQES